MAGVIICMKFSMLVKDGFGSTALQLFLKEVTSLFLLFSPFFFSFFFLKQNTSMYVYLKERLTANNGQGAQKKKRNVFHGECSLHGDYQ